MIPARSSTSFHTRVWKMQYLKLATQCANTNWYPLIGGVICYSRRICYPQIIKDLGLENDLISHNGLTPGMLVTLGEQKILTLTDLADLASDELTGAYDVVKGERVKIKGYLEDFALSKIEADSLIMSARDKVYKD